MVGVVWSVDRDWHLVVLVEVGLGEKTLEGGGRTRDGNSGGAHGTDVGLLRRVDASLFLELLNGSVGSTLSGTGDNGRPAIGGGTRALESISGNANTETSSEGDLDSLDGEGNKLAERAGRGNDGGGYETSAETDGAGVSGERDLGGILLVVTREGRR